jgi:8-oxo-dGTP pyrophosphatase MutT (NUDIX family)
MQVVHAGQPFPPSWSMAVFLAGPTPRSPEVPSWRPEALELLAAAGFRGAVFVPEPASGERFPDHDDQAEWERQGLTLADRILFWVPRDLRTMPALTTNVEFGRWCTSGKAVLGYPPSAPHNNYLGWLAGTEEVPVLHSLRETVAAAVVGWAEAPERSGGERYVPLHVWRTEAFQSWYASLRAAGNRLEEARLLWSFNRPGTGHVFAYVLRARVWVAAEGRYKDNEWVLARPDVACAVLYRRGQAGLRDTEVVLVREFRTPARTPDGFVHELPGGSHAGEPLPPLLVAVEEVREETGLLLGQERLRRVGSRQLAGTLSSHHGDVFAAELTAAELESLRRRAATGQAGGVAQDTERTLLEVVTVGRLLEEGLTDWATVGMVLQALLRSQAPARVPP